MADRKIKYDYLRHVSDNSPDMNKLWDKIDSQLDSRPKNSTPSITVHKNSSLKKIIACAASFVIAAAGIGVYLSSQNNMTQKDNSKTDMAALTENEQTTEETEIYINPDEIINYSSLALEKTNTVNYDETYNAEGDEYFVEDTVLSETEFFADVKVEKADLSDSMCTYKLKVISLVSKNGEQSDSDITITSSMPYILQENREYFIPLKKSDGSYKIVFENAPQIEITTNSEIVFPNTWESLNENSCSVTIEKKSEKDFYFDRMRFSVENDLQQLLTKWRSI